MNMISSEAAEAAAFNNTMNYTGNTIARTSDEARPASEIESELSLLEKEIALSGEMAKVFIDKMGPVLAPDYPSTDGTASDSADDDGKAAQDEPDSVLAKRIRLARFRLHSNRGQLSVATDRARI